MLSALHRAIVHLPIGFIMLVLLLEVIVWWRSRSLGEQHASMIHAHKWLSWMWIAVTGSCIMGLISGILLKDTGYYAGKTFTIHQWTAYGLSLVSCLAALSHHYLNPGSRLRIFLKFLLLPVVVLVGHAGGELSAGPEGLAIAPAPTLPNLAEIDTLRIYPHVIRPIFENKCIRCHEKGNARGGVLMDAPEALLSDTLGDPVIYPGDLERSLGYQRMILSPWDQQHMPPSGPPLTYHEKRLVEWWILENAPFEARLEEVDVPEDILAILQETFNYRTQKRAFYEKVKAAPIDSNTLQVLTTAGWNFSPLAQRNHFLDVHRKGRLDSLSIEDWQALEQIAENIVWLDLSNQALPAEAFKLISRMSNLYRLQLQGTNTKDEDLAALMELQYLHTLNLFGSQITEASLPHLEKMQGLRRLFIGHTPLNGLGVDSVAQLLPMVSVN